MNRRRVKVLNLMTIHDTLDRCLEALAIAKNRVPELVEAEEEIREAQTLIRRYTQRLRNEDRTVIV